MITKAQAIELGEKHYGSTCIHYTGRHDCQRTVGPRGGVTERVTSVRPSGRCQTWKTRPEDFRLPVKFGLYESSEITWANASDWHLSEDCPLAAYHTIDLGTVTTDDSDTDGHGI